MKKTIQIFAKSTVFLAILVLFSTAFTGCKKDLPIAPKKALVVVLTPLETKILGGNSKAEYQASKIILTPNSNTTVVRTDVGALLKLEVAIPTFYNVPDTARGGLRADVATGGGALFTASYTTTEVDPKLHNLPTITFKGAPILMAQEQVLVVSLTDTQMVLQFTSVGNDPQFQWIRIPDITHDPINNPLGYHTYQYIWVVYDKVQ